jgi:pectate lyase
MESATKVAFTATEIGDLTLVFNSTFTGVVMIDGTSRQVSNGLLTMSLNAGTHSITKGDASNMYYVKFEYSPLAVDDQTQRAGIMIYPNPLQNKLDLYAQEGIEGIEIYDLNGTLQGRFSGGHISETIYLNYLRAGTYLLKIHTPSGIKNKLIVKEE